MLSDGAFFGEIALLERSGTVLRTASCIAKTYCDVCTISREDFHRIATRFPELTEAIKKPVEEEGGGKEAESSGGSGGGSGLRMGGAAVATRRTSLLRFQSAARTVLDGSTQLLGRAVAKATAPVSPVMPSNAAVHQSINDGTSHSVKLRHKPLPKGQPSSPSTSAAVANVSAASRRQVAPQRLSPPLPDASACGKEAYDAAAAAVVDSELSLLDTGEEGQEL